MGFDSVTMLLVCSRRLESPDTPANWASSSTAHAGASKPCSFKRVHASVSSPGSLVAAQIWIQQCQDLAGCFKIRIDWEVLKNGRLPDEFPRSFWDSKEYGDTLTQTWLDTEDSFNVVKNNRKTWATAEPLKNIVYTIALKIGPHETISRISTWGVCSLHVPSRLNP